MSILILDDVFVISKYVHLRTPCKSSNITGRLQKFGPSFTYSQVPNKRVYLFIPNKKVGLLFRADFIGLNKRAG